MTTHGHVYQAIEDRNSSHDALTNLLETIEHFLGRLDVYIGLPLADGMGKILVEIMVELLSTIALVTRQIKQSRPCEYVQVAYNPSLDWSRCSEVVEEDSGGERVSGQRVLSLMNVKTALQLYVPVSGQRVLGQCKR